MKSNYSKNLIIKIYDIYVYNFIRMGNNNSSSSSSSSSNSSNQCLICEKRTDNLCCQKCQQIVNIMKNNPENTNDNTQIILDNLSVKSHEVIRNNVPNNCKICDFQPKYILYNCLCKKCAISIRLFEISEYLGVPLINNLDNFDIQKVKFNENRVHFLELLTSVNTF